MAFSFLCEPRAPASLIAEIPARNRARHPSISTIFRTDRLLATALLRSAVRTEAD